MGHVNQGPTIQQAIGLTCCVERVFGRLKRISFHLKGIDILSWMQNAINQRKLNEMHSGSYRSKLGSIPAKICEYTVITNVNFSSSSILIYLPSDVLAYRNMTPPVESGVDSSSLSS